MGTTHRTTIDGKDYKVILTSMPDAEGKERAIVWVRSIRKLEDGSEVDAFLSTRQWKAENRAKSRFAKEINEHLAKFK
ncbi:hypothetical protein [Bosea sp. AS-1]|uniref:hypothetical protein n=1 Tax=Bosea sp. AS-1 TaxID=2015316 RepID=UPI000B78577E|nr:hypothetical protein [Bosea sp. AS-1]